MKTKYIVKKGDTLSSIGQTHGMHWIELAIHNNLTKPDLIYPGDEIYIPTSLQAWAKEKISQLRK